VTAHFFSGTIDLVLQARAVLTRSRLLDATCDALVERGLAGASTQDIAGRAGVSQGALFKHFPTKSELLAAAVEQALAGFVASFRGGITRQVKSSDPIHTAFTILWDIFQESAMRAVFEVYIAARTDDTLAALLTPILERHRAAILAEAHRLFPVTPRAVPELDAAVDAIVYAMQGAALGMFGPKVDTSFLERLARRELERLPRKRRS
jgi:AcrR family transcriptional regulator